MNPFSISSRHRLLYNGAEVRYVPPRQTEGNPMLTRRALIMHFTEGWGLESTLDWWSKPAAKGASAHILIDRDGTVVQCRPFNETAGHAGASTWRDPLTGITYRNLNHCSIGIELCNAGALSRATYPATMGEPLAGKPIPSIKSAHKHGGRVRQWETFPEPQLAVARSVAAALVIRYRLDDVTGHDDIAPDRKEDPGPAFPMTAFRQALGFAPQQ